MKAQNHERKLFDDQLQYGQQKCLANTLHTCLELPLAHLVYAGDVIHALDAVKIALVDGVDAHKTNSPVGARHFAYPDGIAHRMGFDKNHAQGLIARAFAQVVQVRNRQCGQSLIARIALDAVSALQQVRNCRTAHVLVGFVHLDEQCDIDSRIFACEGGSGRTVAFGQGYGSQAVCELLGDKAGDLRAAVAAGELQVLQQHTFLSLALSGIVKAFEHPADVFIAFAVVTRLCEFNLEAATVNPPLTTCHQKA